MQVCRRAGVQVCRRAGVQVCRCAGVQVLPTSSSPESLQLLHTRVKNVSPRREDGRGQVRQEVCRREVQEEQVEEVLPCTSPLHLLHTTGAGSGGRNICKF